MSDLRLIIFDMDGTLVDSQADILAAMQSAHETVGVPVPPREEVLSIIGLSLPEAFAVLHSGLSEPKRVELVEAYKSSFRTARTERSTTPSPLFPGMSDLLKDLCSDPFTLLGVATGKSRRGLDRLIGEHGLEGMFYTQQVADTHPSKPHPSMILTAMRECGVEPGQTVMIGDTSYDMQMARAAGVLGIGVSWGYHAADALGADVTVDTADDLARILKEALI